MTVEMSTEIQEDTHADYCGLSSQKTFIYKKHNDTE